jgi:DNA-binding MarR family transcriptional regulator
MHIMLYNMICESEDTIEALGLLTLGSRLKRLGERLQAEVQPILNHLNPSVAASHHPLLAALDRHPALTIGKLAGTLGVSQPGVTRAVGQLIEMGLVQVAMAEVDGRRRLVSLSPTGRKLVAAAKRKAWPQVERAMADLCDGFGDELLLHLASIEDRLTLEPLTARARRTRHDGSE